MKNALFSCLALGIALSGCVDSSVVADDQPVEADTSGVVGETHEIKKHIVLLQFQGHFANWEQRKTPDGWQTTVWTDGGEPVISHQISDAAPTPNK